MTAETLLDRIRDFKARFPTRYEFLQAFVAGLVAWVAIALLPLQGLETVRRAADEAADRMMRLSNYTTGGLERSVELAIFDIDEPTWHDWGAPLVMPRDKLRDLVAAAVRAKARAIVLDVDLAFTDGPERQRALAEFLQRYPKDAPPLLLVRSLVGPETGATSRYPSPRATPYDAAIASAVAQGASVSWATPMFEQDADGSIRRWRLFEVVCENNAPRIIPSLALAVADLVRQGPASAAPGARQGLDTELAALRPRDCATAAPSNRSVTLAGDGRSRPIVLGGADVGQRVIYRIGWRANEPSLGPRVGDNPPMNLVEVRSARAILAAADVALSRFAGRVVLIGGSFEASGDIHSTPIGAMPGVVVLANAMHALAYSGTPRPPGPWQNAAITLAILAIVSGAVAVFRPAVAALVSSAGIIAVMILSLPIFRSGAVLSLAVPALGSFFHESINSLIKTVDAIREQRWRWVFRPEPKSEGKPKKEVAPP